MPDLPHFLPFRMAYEISQNFPLAHFGISRPSSDNYLLRVEVKQNHPIYNPTGMTVRIDMRHIQKTYSDPDPCVTKLLNGLIQVMTPRIRVGISTTMLQEYAPWMN